MGDEGRRPFSVAIAQSQSSADRQANLDWAAAQAAAAAESGCRLIVFPENVLCWAASQATRAAARPLDECVRELAFLSSRHRIAAIWGGIPVQRGDKVCNTSVCIDADGALLGSYDKTHLFQLFLNDQKAIDECRTYAHGDGTPLTIEIGGWTFGISICYDLRFPELYRQYAGVDALVCTAAFTRSTGRAHWQLLLRARAVENPAYMIGADQCGYCADQDAHAYGHSALIDPWGKVLAEAGDEPTVLIGELDRGRLEHCRKVLPALTNRRL
jgi:nitrilase